MADIDAIIEKTRTKYFVKVHIKCAHCQGGTKNINGRRVSCKECGGEGFHKHYLSIKRWVGMIAKAKEELTEDGII